VHINGTYTFGADRETVYKLMLSKDALAHCLPGAEDLEEIGPDTYRATLKVGVAGVKGTYICTIATTDRVPNESWTLTVEGRSKSGNLKSGGHFTLEDNGEGGTTLGYEGDAELLGPLAGIGQRVMGPASRMINGQFFKCMSGQLSA